MKMQICKLSGWCCFNRKPDVHCKNRGETVIDDKFLKTKNES